MVALLFNHSKIVKNYNGISSNSPGMHHHLDKTIALFRELKRLESMKSIRLSREKWGLNTFNVYSVYLPS